MGVSKKSWATLLWLPLLILVPVQLVQPFDLTDAEQIWLASNRDKLTLWYDSNFPPIEFRSQTGTFTGLGADIIHIMERRLDLIFQATPSDGWSHQLKALETGEAAVVPVIVRTPERERFALFSAPYVTIPAVIITTRDRDKVKTLEEFKGLKVAAVKGYVSERYLQQNYPDLFKIVLVQNVQEGLRDLSFGVVDALVENLAVAAYYIEQEKLPNLRVAGTTSLTYPLSFAVSRHYPLLFSAMQRCYSTVSEEDMTHLVDRWISLAQPDKLSTRQLSQLKAASFLVILFFILFSIIALTLKRQLIEKKRSLEKTRKAQERFEALAETMFNQIIGFMGLLDTSGRIVKVNRTALTIFNTTMAEVEGRYFWEGPWWDDSEAAQLIVQEAIEMVASGGGIYRREVSHVDSHGDKRIVNLIISPYRDEKGDIIYLISEGHDITSTRTAERAVVESEQRFRSIFENAPYAIAIIRFSDGKFLDVNNAFVHQWKRSKEEILKLFSSDISGFSKEKASRSRQRIYELGGVFNVESQVVGADDSPSYLFYSAVPILYGGEPCIISFTVDITDKKKAELDLQASEEKYRAIFNNAPVGIFRTTWEGQFIEANPTLARMLGYASREELLSSVKNLGREIYPRPEERKRLLDALRRTPEEVSLEIEFKRRDGTPFYSKIKASLQMGSNGEPAFLNGTIEDITETKKMQEMMVQSEKMLSLGGIAAGIAHEINNPLGIILQAAQNLTQRTRSDFNKNQSVAKELGIDMEQIEAYMKSRKLDVFLQDIRSAAIRASGIIRHMLDFTRRSESKRQVCDIRLIVEKALALAQNDYDLKKSYDFKKIEIQINVGENLPVISCTETEIEQVLLNLFRNSAQAMAQADPPVERPQITVSLHGSIGKLQIEILDNGPGIPRELQRRIFEPFFTTKAPGIGTGLGLSVSYFIVTKGHGGRFSVTSEPGLGTRFLIELPTNISLEARDE